MRPADAAWIVLVAGVVVWDVACPREEMLSEGVDRYLERRPWLTRMVVAVTAAHILNLLPKRVDPFYRVATAFGR